MPRLASPHILEDAAALQRAGVGPYSPIVEHGHVFIVEDGSDQNYIDSYGVGAAVFSLDLDGDEPLGDRNEFYTHTRMRPEDWTAYECSECYDGGCRQCGDEDTYDPYGGETADDPGAQVSKMLVKNLATRPTRMTSVEIEVGMGGNHLAEEFHAAGLSTSRYMGGYHDMDDSDFVRVEEDSTVAAEVIFSRMRLDNGIPTGDADRFAEGIGIIRNAINENKCKLDLRCGLHIHVNLSFDKESGAKCYSMDAVASLYHLWNYVEDTMFRLGAANWKGHRSEHGNDYTPPIPKGLDSNHNIGRNMQHQRGALNLANYLGSRGSCRCGAFDFGAWSDCTCESLGRSTVEFRVFNTSANTRKIRAYVALAQGLVAAAAAKRYDPDTYQPLEWNESAECDVLASKERLEFLLNELPLTNDERQDILYCAEKSSLHTVLDQEYIRVLWASNE